MFPRTPIEKYLVSHGVTTYSKFADGAILNDVYFPLAGVETYGAVLFADLLGYSKRAAQLSPMECAYLVSHFFAWFEGEAVRHVGALIDKFIGDEVMVVYPADVVNEPPLEAAIRSALRMLAHDPWAFEPKIGIADGPLAIALLGTEGNMAVSAMGNTVNLAARCAQSVPAGREMRVATGDTDLLSELTKGDPSAWEISPPTTILPKNMRPVEVIDVHCTSQWVPMLGFEELARERVAAARKQGTVIAVGVDKKTGNR